jgi:hypothetical protein
MSFAPGVAALIEVKPHPVTTKIDDVGRAGPINVCEADSFLLELIGMIEPGRIVHGHLRTKAAIAEIGPVANFAIAYPHDVGQIIA